MSTFHSGPWLSKKNPEKSALSHRAQGTNTSQPAPGGVDERVQKVLEMVESGKPCTIRSLAHRFNLTHYHLLHLFKQQVGIPLGQLLTKQRLLRAASLLAESNIRIKEIAHETGYEHTSSFVRAFQREFRMTPQRYREQSHSQEKLTKSA